jgi:radical SAM family uncharacterized protein/radical SAM-linked protein
MPLLFEHPYARFLSKVMKPTRYTGSEHGTVKKDWAQVEARICLAFPEVYDIGMSHLGYRILYKILNDRPDTLAERCYAPWTDMQRELVAHGEFLRSHETARPLVDFDVVGFSLQFELTYTNILMMLELGGIPLRSSARSDDDPLILVGGPVATHLEPLSMFVDAALIGDGEEAAAEIALAWVDAKKRGLPRVERLRELAKIRGVYVPSLYEVAVDPTTGIEVVQRPESADVPFPVLRRVVDDIDKFPFPDDGPVGGPEAVFDRMSIEIARGCTEGCRFCQAGMIYRPVRERDPEKVVETVLRALEKSGQDEVSLTALSTADVSCISPLIQRLVEKTAPERVSLGVASLRAYGLAEELLDDMRQVRASGLTFAPEAGTQRMRDVINKNVTEAQLMETAERVFSRGFDSMKLYFIVGLPTETDEDVLGIVEVGKNALAVGKRVGARPKVVVSVSTHVPKPHTPFQWCAMDTLDEIRKKQQLLRDGVRRFGGLKLRLHDSTTTVLEGIMARGDRRLGLVIERAYRNGARFDSWDDQLKLDVWQEAFEHFGVETGKYLGTLPVDARLPWDHLDVGLEPGFLAREYRRAVNSRLSPPCGKAKGMHIHHTNTMAAEADQRKLICYDCGVACDLGKMREERIVFLRKMGAFEPGERARLRVLQPEPVAARKLEQPEGAEHAPEPVPPPPPRRKARPELFRPPRTGGPATRLRIQFAKTGASALLGHLDLIRELPRVIRRAGVRTWYTEGFHPKPDMSFGPALSLGVASLCEYFDVKLIDAPNPVELVERLNRVAAGGLSFVAARNLPDDAPGLGEVLDGARYTIAIPPEAISADNALEALQLRIAEFLSKDSLRVRREVKQLAKLVDVRQGVRALTLGDETSRGLVERAGIVGRALYLDAEISLGQQGAVKVTEIIEAVFGAKLPHIAVRTALLSALGTPLDIVARPKRAPATVPFDLEVAQ